MYTRKNYQTKKALKADFMAGKSIECYQPGGIFPGTKDGYDVVELPHGVHKYYCRVKLQDYIIVELDGKKRPEKPKVEKPQKAARKYPSDPELFAMLERDDNEGFCLACGEEAYGVEPDARGYECESCGKREVYGAPEILMMGAYK